MSRSGKKIVFLSDINSVHTQRWVESLVAQKCTIAIYSLSAKSTDWVDTLPNVSYTCFGLGNDVIRAKSTRSKMSYFGAAKEVKKFVENAGPDVVHAHYASSYGMLARRVKHPNTILSLWGSDVYQFPKRSILHRWLFKRTLKFMKYVTSTSHDMVREAELYVKRDYEVIPFGINTDRFKIVETTRSDEFVIGTVKSLEEVYGIDRLIRVFAAFKKESKENVLLKIFGKGSQEEALKKQVTELELEECVEFCGFVSGDALIEAYNQLDIYVALSHRESFGVAILEAQSCGVPVVASNVGGLPEVVDRNTGELVEDELEALNALRNIRKSHTDSKKQVARNFVVENYSINVSVEKLMTLYKKSIDS